MRNIGGDLVSLKWPESVPCMETPGSFSRWNQSGSGDADWFLRVLFCFSAAPFFSDKFAAGLEK